MFKTFGQFVSVFVCRCLFFPAMHKKLCYAFRVESYKLSRNLGLCSLLVFGYTTHLAKHMQSGYLTFI